MQDENVKKAFAKVKEDMNLLKEEINSNKIAVLEQNKALEDIKNLNQTITFRFKSLTDREFSIFFTIYELEQEIGGDVTYIDLANRLNLTESSVKTHVNRILSKQIPIQKERFFNRKSSLSIKKGFKDPKMLAELIKLRRNPKAQTTLFDL